MRTKGKKNFCWNNTVLRLRSSALCLGKCITDRILIGIMGNLMSFTHAIFELSRILRRTVFMLKMLPLRRYVHSSRFYFYLLHSDS